MQNDLLPFYTTVVNEFGTAVTFTTTSSEQANAIFEKYVDEPGTVYARVGQVGSVESSNVFAQGFECVEGVSETELASVRRDPSDAVKEAFQRSL